MNKAPDKFGGLGLARRLQSRCGSAKIYALLKKEAMA